MKRRRAIAVVAGGVAIAVVGVWLSPDRQEREKRRIRERLIALTAAMSFRESDAPFARLAYAGRVADFFDDPTVFNVNLGTRRAEGPIRRAQIVEGAAGMRATARGLSVEFFDSAVTLGADNETATAHVTSKIYFLGDPDYFVQEFKFNLRKDGNNWKVHGLATVRTMLQ